MCKPTPLRVLFVYGSETGKTSGHVEEMVKKLQKDVGEKIKVTCMEGDSAADEFDTVPDSYNVLLVAVSSYGEGECPTGYGKFLYHIQQAAKKGVTLKGLEHAVIGFGSSYYSTFQNIPRLTDRTLGQAGSRRFLQRKEVDEMDDPVDGKNEGLIEEWITAVAKHLSTNQFQPDSKPVCAFQGSVYEKTIGPDGVEVVGGGGGGMSMILSIIVGVAAAAAGAYFYYKQSEEAGMMAE